jgi:hypothetical protein
VDKGGGEVGLPITGHAFLAEQVVVLAGTVNYDGAYAINSKTANEIVITATYVAEVFAGTETVNFDRVPIVKADFRALEEQIQGQFSARPQPPLVWVDTGTVRIEATADCPAEMAFTGMPNIMNHTCQVDGGLSDRKIRSAVANVSCILGAGGFYGTTQTEKSSQWYVVFAVAADDAADYELKAMPIMRVKSQTGQAIKTGTLADPSAGIDYGFTDDDLAGGMVYFLTGASKGLMRSISANDVDTDTRITYTGAALTVAQDDWFIVLPPTNFRLVGTFFNNSSGHIHSFERQGNFVQWKELQPITVAALDNEDIRICCPFAVEARVVIGLAEGDIPGDATIGYYGCTEDYLLSRVWIQSISAPNVRTTQFQLTFCKYRTNSYDSHSIGYYYPPGCGY